MDWIDKSWAKGTGTGQQMVGADYQHSYTHCVFIRGTTKNLDPSVSHLCLVFYPFVTFFVNINYYLMSWEQMFFMCVFLLVL